MMGKLKFIAALCSAILAAGCSLTEAEWVKFDDFSDLDQATCFIPYRVEDNCLDGAKVNSFNLPGGNSVKECLAEEDNATKATYTNGANLIRGLMSSFNSSTIKSYCGTYMSRDHEGKPIRLSGRIMVPADGKVSRIMVVSHFTIGNDAEAPSAELPMEAIYAAKGLAVIESDYIGYGVTRDRIHPYLCSKVTAGNVIDMYYAALPFLRKIGCTPQYDDIFLLGFSQGGAVNMSVTQELCRNHPDVRIRLSMCGGGPYDICATYDTLIEKDFTDYPCAIPMIIQGLCHGMGIDVDYNDYFLPRMVENLDEWINSKHHYMADITALIGSKKISSIMTESAMRKTSDKMTELYRAMLDNSATYGGIPTCPMYIFHSIDDNVVPFINAYNMMYTLGDINAIVNIGHFGTHQISTLRFFLCCIDLLKENGDIR